MNSELNPAANGAPDDEEIPVSTLYNYSLVDQQSREEFLFCFYWIGEIALFAAVSHVWERLAEPREWRCTQMGQLSGAGGYGKAALLMTLKQFLEEALAAIEPFPVREDYPDPAAWHEAVMRSFTSDQTNVEIICRRYAAVLDGSAMCD